MTLRNQVAPTLGVLAALTFLSCTGEPVRSTCEAYCDWAVTCHETERPIDADVRRQMCLEATRARDATCAKAEDGTIDPATKELTQPCVDAIDAATSASECEGFVGTIDQIKASTPPAECVTAGGDTLAAWEDTRESTQETGQELCTRFAETYCGRAEECILGDFQVPQAVIDEIGTPFDICVNQLKSAFTDDCAANDLYAGEASIDDLNATRQAARECLRDFSAVSCEALSSGDPEQLPEFCAGAFTTPDQALAVAEAVLGVYQQFEAAAQ